MLSSKSPVLVIDDEKDLAESIKGTLESSPKYKGLTANSAQDALRILEEHKTHRGGNHIKCILLDIKMPGMDGLQFLEEIRQKYREEIGVIIVSAYEDDEKWGKALHGKVLGYLTKPFNSAQLLEMVDAAFEGESAKEDLKISAYDKYFDKFKKYKREV